MGQIVGAYARQLYVCIGCNTPLFSSKDVIEQNVQELTTASSTGRVLQSNKKVSQYYYIKHREWMPNLRADSTEKSKGILECYRKVCKRKLGQYNLQGIKTNCGKTIKPGF